MKPVEGEREPMEAPTRRAVYFRTPERKYQIISLPFSRGAKIGHDFEISTDEDDTRPPATLATGLVSFPLFSKRGWWDVSAVMVRCAPGTHSEKLALILQRTNRSY